jgi:hypothetical protein
MYFLTILLLVCVFNSWKQIPHYYRRSDLILENKTKEFDYDVDNSAENNIEMDDSETYRVLGEIPVYTNGTLSIHLFPFSHSVEWSD